MYCCCRPKNSEVVPESFAVEVRVLPALKCPWKLAYAKKGEQCMLHFHVSERKELSGLTMNYITNNKFKKCFPHSNYLLVKLFHFIPVLNHLLNEPSVYTRMIFFGGVIYACIILHQGFPAICFKFHFPCMLSCSIICIIWGLILEFEEMLFPELVPNC